MGDIPDAMIDGTFCQHCGEYLDGESPGYPRSCDGCKGWQIKPNKREAIEAAGSSFDEVAALAQAHGMKLRQCTDAHYQLSHVDDGWLLNLYPSNCRIYADKNKPRAPYLNFAGVEWSLRDVVETAINKQISDSS